MNDSKYKKLEQVMQEKSVTMYRLHKALGINYSDIHGAFTGKRPFYNGYKKRISEYLGVERKELFEEE